MSLKPKSLHDQIYERETNAIYYLMRKFNLITETINIQQDIEVSGKYATYKWDTQMGELYIENCIPTTNYQVIYSILNTETKLIRTVTVNGDVNSENTVTINIPSAASNEILQTEINVEITYPQNITENPYQLTVTADKPIIQADETTTFTAELKYNNTAVSGKTLNYKLLHGSTVLDSGSDTTDNQGKITITYTGTAIGQVDVVVSYGMLLQETYEVLDAIFYDDGVTSPKTTTYYNSGFQISIDSTGTLLDKTTTGWGLFWLNQNNGTDKPFSKGICIEWDNVSKNGEMRFQIVGDTSNYYNYYVDNNAHIKITIDEDYITRIVNNGNPYRVSTSDYITNNFRMGFVINGVGNTTYKNIKIYPI